jgi:hypothetical protein
MTRIALPSGRVFAAVPAALLIAAWSVASAQTLSPVDLVRKAVQNEISSSSNGPNFLFREVSQGTDGSKTKLLVETDDAMAGMLIANNGHPLTTEQRQAEEKRLEHLVKDPDDLQKKRKHEKEDAGRMTEIMKAFPEAFLYDEDGTTPGEEGVGAPGDQLVRLKFRPNPKYSPPSHVEQILTGLQGEILIDSKQHRIAKIDGSLIKQVEFGWGILGHLDRGGHFIVQQADIGRGNWEMTAMDLSFTGKALFFKTLNIKSKEIFSDFQPAPRGLTFAQGVELLKKQQALLAQNESAASQNVRP